MNYKQLYEQNRLSPQALRNCGFQEGPSSSFSYELYRAQLTRRGSCMRDTLMTAMVNFQRLQDILIQAGRVKKWKFCHVIVCTMPDSVSRINQKFAIAEITKMNYTWQVDSFNTIFVPICMDSMQQILNFCQIGGDWTPIPATYDDFPEKFNGIMQKIRTTGNIDRWPTSTKKQCLTQDQSEAFYTALTLSVEASQTMIGRKWQRILLKMTKNDIISGIIYSVSPWVVAQIKQTPVQLTRNEPLSQYLINRSQDTSYTRLHPKENVTNKYPLYADHDHQQARPSQRSKSQRAFCIGCLIFTVLIIAVVVFVKV